MNKTIRKFSPMTEASYYILLSLIHPLHGYGIIKKVEEMSNGRVKLAAGTLYGALNALVENKIIQPVGEDRDNPRRKLYQMTNQGQELIRYEINRLQEMVENGRREIA